MSLSALDSVGDAVDATKRFLLPFDRARWFRLAVAVFFIGGGLSFPNIPSGGFGDAGGPAGPGPGGPGPGTVTPELTTTLLVFLAVLVVLVVAIGLLFAVTGASMEFVFVESLSREEVRLWAGLKRHWRRGVRLFVFRFGVWVLTVGTLVGGLLAVGAALGGWPISQWGAGTALALAGLGIPLGILALLVVGTVLGFTTMFVVPVMFAEQRGVIGAWRRFWPTLTGTWKEFLAYLFVSFVLGIGVGIASGFLSLLVLVVVGIPFAVVGVPVVLLLGFSGLGALVALVLGLAFVVVVFVGFLLVSVPFQTFMRYYALFVLGDANPEFDVIPDARAAVRADGGDDEGPGGPDTGGGPGGPDTGGYEGSDTSGAPGETGGEDPWADRGSGDDDWNVDRS